MPWWISLINSALFSLAVPFVVGFIVHIAHIKAQRLPEHWIPAVEQLALQIAKSMVSQDGAVESRIKLADVEFIKLLQEYRVHIPSEQMRKHALSAAFFDLNG